MQSIVHCTAQPVALPHRATRIQNIRFFDRPRRSVAASAQQSPVANGEARTRRMALLGCGCGLAALCCCAPKASARSQWYDSYFAYAMQHSMATYESAIAPVKARLFSTLCSDASVNRILEVGVGTGPNFTYYARYTGSDGKEGTKGRPLRITGLDPNPEMRPYAEQSAAAAGLREGFEFVQGDAARVPFDESSFDAVVVTLVSARVAGLQIAVSPDRLLPFHALIRESQQHTPTSI